MMSAIHKGSCLCGEVSFEVSGDLPAADACHCSQCRKHSGHYFVSSNVPYEALTIRGAERISWYRSSAKVERGFCARCGSSLFWKPLGKSWLAIALGAFEKPTGARIALHIFVADKGDYYDIDDGLPQHAGFPKGPH